MIAAVVPLCPCGAKATVRVAAGARCQECRPREYGQHNERNHPQTVTITLGSRRPGSPLGPLREGLEVAIPEATRRQRAAINAMAHEAGRVLEVYP